MKKLTYFVVALSALIFLASIGGLLLSKRPIDVQSFYASVNITNRAGFDLNGTALTFGNVLKDSTAVRRISFDNFHPYPVIAKIKVNGKIGSLLYFENYIRLEEGESKSIAFTVVPPDNVTEGFYDGIIEFQVLPG